MANIVKQNTNTNNKGLTVYILKIFGYTLTAIVFAFFYIISVLLVFNPRSAAKIFEVIGSDSAVTICYEQEYRKNPTNENLYNVIQQAVQTEDNDRVEKYCYQLMNSKSYTDFENEINQVFRAKVGKAKIAYVYDVDSYLTSVYVKALYTHDNKDYARQEFHLRDLQRDDHPYTISLVTYVNCFYEDENKTDEDISDFSEYFHNFKVNEKSIKEWLEEKLSVIESTEELTDGGRIFNVYTQIRVNTCFYKIYDIFENDSQKQVYAEKIASLQTVYNDLISQ